MANGAGARPGRVAAAEEQVGAGRSDNRRARVLSDRQPAERTRRFLRPRQFGVDPERQAIGPNRAVDGDRAQRRERHAGAGDRAEIGIEILDELEEHERAIAPHQRQSPLAFAPQPVLEARERHGVFGDLSRLDQNLPNRRIRQAVAAVVSEARAASVDKFDLRRALYLNKESLDGVAKPDERIAALPFDRRPIVIGDKRAVAEAPSAADSFRKSDWRLPWGEGYEIDRSPQYGPAKLLRFNPRRRNARLVVTGEKSALVVGNDAERSKARLEEPPGVSLARDDRAKRCVRVGNQSGRRGTRRPRTVSTRDKDARRVLESSQRRQMAVPGPALEAFEIERLETGRHRSSTQSRGSA